MSYKTNKSNEPNNYVNFYEPSSLRDPWKHIRNVVYGLDERGLKQPGDLAKILAAATGTTNPAVLEAERRYNQRREINPDTGMPYQVSRFDGD